MNMAKKFDRNSPLVGASVLLLMAWNAEPVGASLLAKAVFQTTSVLAMPPPSRAGSLPHWLIGVA